MIERVVVACVAVVCLGALAYAQVAREGTLETNDPVNVGGTYQASFCADKTFLPSSASANYFYMRVTARFNRGWWEADVSPRLKPKSIALDAPATKLWINEAQLCWLQVAEALK